MIRHITATLFAAPPAGVILAQAASQPSHTWDGPAYLQALALLVSALTGLVIALRRPVPSTSAEVKGSVPLLILGSAIVALSITSCAASPANKIAAADQLYTSSLRTASKLYAAGQLPPAADESIDKARREAKSALESIDAKRAEGKELTQLDATAVSVKVAAFAGLVESAQVNAALHATTAPTTRSNSP
jgi:hypothetical protein